MTLSTDSGVRKILSTSMDLIFSMNCWWNKDWETSGTKNMAMFGAGKTLLPMQEKLGAPGPNPILQVKPERKHRVSLNQAAQKVKQIHPRVILNTLVLRAWGKKLITLVGPWACLKDLIVTWDKLVACRTLMKSRLETGPYMEWWITTKTPLFLAVNL
jgi:hypothetical protein